MVSAAPPAVPRLIRAGSTLFLTLNSFLSESTQHSFAPTPHIRVHAKCRHPRSQGRRSSGFGASTIPITTSPKQRNEDRRLRSLRPKPPNAHTLAVPTPKSTLQTMKSCATTAVMSTTKATSSPRLLLAKLRAEQPLSRVASSTRTSDMQTPWAGLCEAWAVWRAGNRLR